MSGAESDPILYEEHPAVFRNNPLLTFLLFISVIGWVVLIWWWIKSLGAMLTITNTRIIHRTGLLSKNENEVRIKHVRNVQIRQTFFQRIMNTGYIGISTAGQSGVEIAMNGMPDPDGVQEIINSRLGDVDDGE
ncbi:MAG: PH domain-containing protein [Planctomycetaceae bacterium]